MRIHTSSGGVRKIEFTVTETFGTECSYEWFARQVKQLAKDKYGMEIEVEINPKYRRQIR
ncbi:hypothetical protein EDM52_18585 [Brevibacillus invocatus]|uniref:Uncharacterized protein n=1 Tax=Brevibacillus invocatus TaxID=173959 RepID=A0A3M8C4Y6_9BACL|nr:hypothetical protein EDM52_18585 [Brevibacillus invocatus]